MKALLKQTQRYGILVTLVIVVGALVSLLGLEGIDKSFGAAVDLMATVLLWSPPIPLVEKLPLVVLVLFGGAVFFTFRFGLINLRAFKHAIDVTMGKYDNPDDPGEVSHFQALSSALSATVGLGNIAGVAIAVSVGGPGAIFWMMATAVFGMASKFTECTLGQLYRRVDARGDVRGGPMVYLRDGIEEVLPKGKWLGVGLSVLFAVLCIGASFGGGNMFQVNQAFNASQTLMPFLAGDPSTGAVRLTADAPVAVDLPAQQVRFKTRQEVSYYTASSAEPVEWAPVEASESAQAGFVAKLAVNEDEAEGIWSLGEDQEATLEVLTERGDGLEVWAPVADIAVTGLQKSAEGGSGHVTLSSQKATSPNLAEARVRVTPKDGRHPYFPAVGLSVAEADWQKEDGQFVTYVDVRSAGESQEYDIGPGMLRTMEVAAIQGREIAGWHPVVNVEVLNQDSISGGKDNTTAGLGFGLIMAFLVGVVIIGGIKSISKVAEKIVPAMCVMYVATGLLVVFLNIELLPEAVGVIIGSAFSLEAGLGALMGVIATGVTRAAFSSEAGIGSAAIAHSAAKTSEPVREGIVALLEPFIDTIVVCFITGIVIVISGAYNDPTSIGMEGVQLTARAFGQELSWFPYILSGAVFLFAYSTMISWSYYGERSWTELFGADQSMVYRIIFLMFIVLGSVSSLNNVLAFSDFMILSMAFPNIIGMVILSNKVARELKAYWSKYKNDEFTVYE